MRQLMSAVLAVLGFSLAAHAEKVAIRAGTLIVEAGEDVRARQTLLIEDGVITELLDGYTEVTDAALIDLSDHVVLPGLIDSHVHLWTEWSPTARLELVTRSDGDVAFHALANAQKSLMAGFTTVQDVGGSSVVFDLRDAINAGLVVGPRIRASGPALTPTGGHGDTHGYRQEVLDVISPSYNTCDGAADCRRATREAIKRGADVIKITATGGVLSNTAAGVERQFFDDELEAIVETAAQMGRKVTAHAHGKSGIDAAVRAGVASIEHGSFLDRESTALFRRQNAVLVPTMLAGATVTGWTNEPWLPEASRAKAAAVGPALVAMVGIAHANGVTIAFGTDTGVSRHGENAQEFALMIKAGMTPEDALRAATVIAAEHVELADTIGKLEPGFAADIIAVPSDPREDITVLEDIPFVMKGGQVVKGL